MQSFQEKTGVISVEEQTKAVIESIANLKAQIAAKEVEIKVMETYTEPKNPDLQKAHDALNGMKEQLQAFEIKGGDNVDLLVPTKKMPEVGADYARKLREVKYQESLFELISQQYEIASVDEARDAIIIQVLDKALQPAMRARPKRTQMVIMATFAGFFLAIFSAFLIEYVKKVSSDEGNKKMIELIKTHSFFTGKIKNN
jgi:tyrosine-protein kinase Etk/Wzc